MQINRFTLTFRGEDTKLEEGFLKNYLERSTRVFRIALALAIFIYAAFGFLDAILFPELKEELWFVRFALVCPWGLAALVFSYLPPFKRYWQATIAATVIVAGLGVIAMMWIAPPPENFSSYAGLILVLFYSYTVPRGLFVWSSATGWALLVCYEITALWFLDTPPYILIHNNLFFISANLIGMIACYSMEYSARRNYYLYYHLQEKNRELEQALEKVKALSGFLPICMHCKKIRDDQGFWNQLELYLSTHSEAQFSHSLCPECMAELYPEIFPKKNTTS